MLSKTVLGTTAAAAFLIVSTALYADSAPIEQMPSSITMRIGDLNLQRAGDVATLYHRLREAAEEVCGSRAFTGFFYTLPAYQSCVADTLHTAVANLNRAPLTAFYMRQGQSSAIKVAAQ